MLSNFNQKAWNVAINNIFKHCFPQQDYKGKDISEVKKKSRTLKTYTTRAQTALWFARSFGLEVESIAMKEVKTGSKHNTKMAIDEQQENTTTELDSLSEEEKEKVDQILFF